MTGVLLPFEHGLWHYDDGLWTFVAVPVDVVTKIEVDTQNADHWIVNDQWVTFDVGKTWEEQRVSLQTDLKIDGKAIAKALFP